MVIKRKMNHPIHNKQKQINKTQKFVLFFSLHGLNAISEEVKQLLATVKNISLHSKCI